MSRVVIVHDVVGHIGVVGRVMANDELELELVEVTRCHDHDDRCDEGHEVVDGVRVDTDRDRAVTGTDIFTPCTPGERQEQVDLPVVEVEEGVAHPVLHGVVPTSLFSWVHLAELHVVIPELLRCKSWWIFTRPHVAIALVGITTLLGLPERERWAP